jgi:hypothetical protein
MELALRCMVGARGLRARDPADRRQVPRQRWHPLGRRSAREYRVRGARAVCSRAAFVGASIGGVGKLLLGACEWMVCDIGTIL